MAKGLIESFDIKITRSRAEALHEMHEWMVAEFVPENNHEHLLHAHLVGMMWKLEGHLENSKQKKFTVKVTAPEALAFLLLWGNERIDMRRRGAPVVCDLIKQIDKEYKGNLWKGAN
jgi:hypothetical protein